MGDKQSLWLYGLNGTGVPQAVELMDEIVHRSAFDPGHIVLGISLQETKAVAFRNGFEQARELFHRHKFFTMGAPATTLSGGGPSAGVMVGAVNGRANLGLLPCFSTADISPSDDPGRLCGAFLSSTLIATNGLALFSIYLHHNEPISSWRNRALLNRAAEAILAHGGLFILQGDFQTDDFSDPFVSEFLARLKAVVVSPSGDSSPSCSSGRHIDHFILPACLAQHVLSCTTLGSFLARQHRPVAIEFSRHIRANGLVVVRQMAWAFPRQAPQRPSRDFEPLLDRLEVATRTFGGAVQECQLVEGFSHVVAACEWELCNLYDKVNSHGKINKTYFGRHHPFRLIHQHQLQPVSSCYGVVSRLERGHLTLCSELELYLHHLHALGRLGASLGRVYSCAQVRARLARPRGVLAEYLEDNAVWKHAVGFLLSQDETWGELAPKVARLLAHGRRKASSQADARRLGRSRSYWAWVDDQLRCGAGKLHALCKVAPLKPEAVLEVDRAENPSGFSRLPRDVLDRALAAWKKVWLRHPDATTPWRDTQGRAVGPPCRL